MKTIDVKGEQRVLVTVLETPSTEIRNHLLSEALYADFGTDEGLEIRKRMDSLIRKGKDLGDVTIFQEDPVLSDKARQFLRVSPQYKKKASEVSLDRAKKMVGILHDHRKGRALYRSAEQLIGLCQGQYQDDTMRNAEKLLLDSVQALREDRSKNVVHLGGDRTEAQVKKHVYDLVVPQEGQFISTGLKHLDAHMKGFERGDLVVLSAQRGGAKSAMMLQMAVNQFKAGLNVGIGSMEMTRQQLEMRLLANVTDTLYDTVRQRAYADKDAYLRTYRKWKQFELDTATKHGNRFSIWELKGQRYTPANIELDLGPFGYDVIYIDYLTMFDNEKKDLWQAQKDNSLYLKQLAGRLRPQCVIVVLTQLSEDDRVKYGRGPEEDADYWLWWRYGEEEKESGQVDLRLAKARHTRGGVIPAHFRLEKMQITTAGELKTAMSSYAENRKKRGSRAAQADAGTDWEVDLGKLEDVRDEVEKTPWQEKKNKKKRRGNAQKKPATETQAVW